MPPLYTLFSRFNGTIVPPGNGTSVDKPSINGRNDDDPRFIVVMTVCGAASLLCLAFFANDKIFKLRARWSTVAIVPSQAHALPASAQLPDPHPCRNCLAAMAKRWPDKFKIRPLFRHRGSFMRDAYKRRAPRPFYLSNPSTDDTSAYAPNRKLLSHSETSSIAPSTASLVLAPLSGPDQIYPPPLAHGCPPWRAGGLYRYGGHSAV